jgi:hypothetical protein
MFQQIADQFKEWFRRLSRPEAKEENALRDRTRAHIEIAGALSNMTDTEGWQQLVQVVSRNKQFLSSKTLMLTNAVLFISPNADQPDIEFLKRRLQLIDHLREELQSETADEDELHKILNPPKDPTSKKD